MDSLSQIVLGAAVGETTLGKKLGYKAMLWGALAGTLPDLDIISNIFVKSETIQLTIHRSYTHAFFFQILFSIFFAYISKKIHPQIQTKIWFLFWVLGLTTHSILDCFTTYGTQIFLPFSSKLVGFNNISVVDPLYTLPFMAILMLCLFFKKDSKARVKIRNLAWAVSLGYMSLTFVAKYFAHINFKNNLNAQGIKFKELSTSPTIFNAMLWAGIATNNDSIYLAEYSIWQKNQKIEWQRYAVQKHLTQNFESPSLEVLGWFSQGKYLVEKTSSDTLSFYIAKWGRQDYRQTRPDKSFRFFYQLFKQENGKYEIKAVQRYEKGDLKAGLKDLWNRIFYY